MSVYEIIIASIGGSAALVAVLGWLAKSFVSNLLDKDIEKYKTKLSAEKDAQIENLKHELQKVSTEHKVRFEKLHSRRDEVIANLYSHIVDFYQAVDRFLDYAIILNEESLEKETKLLWEAVDSFKNYSEKHRIYFSEEICARLDSLYEAADKPTSRLMVAVEHQDIDEDENGTLIDSWKGAREALEVDVKQIRETLEKDFRDLLGVEH